MVNEVMRFLPNVDIFMKSEWTPTMHHRFGLILI